MSIFNLFHEKEVDAARTAISITKRIEDALSSKEVLDLFLLFPGGDAIDKEAIALCEMGIKGIEALQVILDSKGVEGRLKRLADDLTALRLGHKKNIGYYIKLAQAAWDDLFGKGGE